MAKSDYTELLKYFNRKSLANQVSKLFGLDKDEYRKLVIRLLPGTEGASLRAAIKKWLPPIPPS